MRPSRYVKRSGVLMGALAALITVILLSAGSTATPVAAAALPAAPATSPIPAHALPAGTDGSTAPSNYACQQPLANGCVSLIADAHDRYCLSSFHSRTGAVREAPCQKSNLNEEWYVVGTGAEGTEEIWNVGDSCPSSGSGSWTNDKCGTPLGYAADKDPNFQNYGYCIAVKGGQARANAELVMSQCYNGNGTFVQNNPFLLPLSFRVAGHTADGADYFISDLSHAGSGTYLISTRGQARPGATYVLQRSTASSQKAIEFFGGSIGSYKSVQYNSNGAPETNPFFPVKDLLPDDAR